MTPTVIICRHGNTFNQGEKVVMIGVKEDLSLTDEGMQQAVLLGSQLANTTIKIDRVLSSALKRAVSYAEILCKELNFKTPVNVDKRLNEIDYGLWSGLSNDEIVSMYGEEELKDWNQRGIWPKNANFCPSEQQLYQETKELLNECQLKGGVTLMITSNGRARYFGKLTEAEGKQDFKMRTGHVSLLVYSGKRWNIAAWNIDGSGLADSSLSL